VYDLVCKDFSHHLQHPLLGKLAHWSVTVFVGETEKSVGAPMWYFSTFRLYLFGNWIDLDETWQMVGVRKECRRNFGGIAPMMLTCGIFVGRRMTRIVSVACRHRFSPQLAYYMNTMIRNRMIPSKLNFDSFLLKVASPKTAKRVSFEHPLYGRYGAGNTHLDDRIYSAR